MPTIEELAKTYESKTDSELFEIYQKKEDYSDDALAALKIEINRRDNYEQFIKKQENLAIKEEEKQRIFNYSMKMFSNKLEQNDFRQKITSKHLSQTEIDEVITQAEANFEKEREDQKVNPKILMAGILGGFVGGTFGGILLGIQMVQTNYFIKFIILGLAFISYIFIKLFTKRSKNNIIVFTLTILSTLYAIALGVYIYNHF